MCFWTGSLSKSVKTCDKRSTFAIPMICSYFQYFSVRNLYAKQNKSQSESNVSCLKQGSEMRSFCLKQGKASVTHLYQNFPCVPPPPPPGLCVIRNKCSNMVGNEKPWYHSQPEAVGAGSSWKRAGSHLLEGGRSAKRGVRNTEKTEHTFGKRNWSYIRNLQCTDMYLSIHRLYAAC